MKLFRIMKTVKFFVNDRDMHNVMYMYVYLENITIGRVLIA